MALMVDGALPLEKVSKLTDSSLRTPRHPLPWLGWTQKELPIQEREELQRGTEGRGGGTASGGL